MYPNARAARSHNEFTTRSVLSVSGDRADHNAIRQLLRPWNGTIYEAGSPSSAHDRLSKEEIGVVLCERDLGTENWLDLLESLFRLRNAPPLIVTSRLADDWLWAEALNRGAYDVLAKPFDGQELLRTVNLAWLRWHHARDFGIESARGRTAIAS
jgi:DNA-binding NtrC family response regulator